MQSHAFPPAGPAEARQPVHGPSIGQPRPRGAAALGTLGTLGTLLALAALLPACGDSGSGSGAGEWQAQVDTLGDTIVVRTVSGSEWGTAHLVPELRIGVLEGEEHEMFGEIAGLAVDAEGHIYVYDRHATALRKFGPDGEYLGNLGRQGAGPGEIQNSDGGLVTLPDGRVVIRDPGNGRFTVWGSDGSYLSSWSGPTGAFTSIPLFPGQEGGFYSYNFAAGTRGLVRYARDGAPQDTLALPDREVEPAMLSAEVEGMMSRRNVPFWPRALWTFHPDGYFVSAVSDRYAVDLLRGEAGVLRGEAGVLRMERMAEPVPVSREERSAQERRTIEAMRQVDPSWRWDGPSIPQMKPLIRALHTGEDGRIWVQLHRPGELVEEEEEPRPDGSPPIPLFEEPIVFDVFEPDGRYLGRVTAPEGFSTFPRVVFRGDRVWATERDDLGVQYVVRYRLEPTG